MGANHRHLLRRESAYYWRCRLPNDIARLWQRSHICRSLRTSDAILARRLVRRVSVQVESLFDSLRMQMSDARLPTPADLNRLLAELFQGILDGGEQERSQVPPGTFPAGTELEDNCPPDDDNDDEDREPDLEPEPPSYPQTCADFYRSAHILNDYESIRPLVRKLLDGMGMAEPPLDSNWIVFLRKALVTAATAHSYDAQRLDGHYAPAVHPYREEISMSAILPIPIPSGSAPTPLCNRPQHGLPEMLSDAYASYCEAKVKTWSPKTRDQAETALRLFISTIGDVPWQAINGATAAKFKDELGRIPSLFGRSVYVGQDACQAVQLATGSPQPFEAARQSPFRPASRAFRTNGWLNGVPQRRSTNT